MSVATNDQKRGEMGYLVRRLLQEGWTSKQLAALMRVTPSTVNTWGRGDSMGTNAQRQTLRELGTVEEERPRMREIAAQLRREAGISDTRAAEAYAAGAHHVEANHRNRAARLRARAEFLEGL